MALEIAANVLHYRDVQLLKPQGGGGKLILLAKSSP